MARVTRTLIWALAGVTFIVAVSLALGTSLKPPGKVPSRAPAISVGTGAGSGTDLQPTTGASGGVIELSDRGRPGTGVRLRGTPAGAEPRQEPGEGGDERRDDDNSGPGSGSEDPDDSENSGPGSDNSGPGGGGSDEDD